MLELIPAAVGCGGCWQAACVTLLGTIFLMNDHRHRYLHAVWHLWVIAGTRMPILGDLSLHSAGGVAELSSAS